MLLMSCTRAAEWTFLTLGWWLAWLVGLYWTFLWGCGVVAVGLLELVALDDTHQGWVTLRASFKERGK